MRWYKYAITWVIIVICLICVIYFGTKLDSNHIDPHKTADIANEILKELKELRKDLNNNSIK
jgi:hypothetical protein